MLVRPKRSSATWIAWSQRGVVWGAAAAIFLACLLGLGATMALGQPVMVITTEQPLPGSQFQGGDGNQDDTATLIDWHGLGR